MNSEISSIVLKLASRCNLNCSYCYIYNHEDRSYRRRPKFIRDEIYDATLARIREYCERRGSHAMSVVFHGGEPTLIGPDRFAELAMRARSYLDDRLRRLSMQTNGTLLDDRWIEVIRRTGTSVGVSLDGPPEIHDSARVDHRGRGSYEATMRGIQLLGDAGMTPRILSVVLPGQSGADVYRHFRGEGIKWMTFLLPDVSHDNKERLYGRYGPTPVADFLIPIFDAWFDEDDPGVVIGIFHDLLKRMLGGPGDTDCFGNPLMTYLIVETDGAIEALDALRVCGEGVANSGLNVLTDGFDDLHRGMPLLHRAVHEGFPLPAACRGCEFRAVCGGGFLPHRYSRTRGFDNPSVWCEDIKLLLAHMRARIGPERAVACPPGTGTYRVSDDDRACASSPRVVSLPVLLSRS